MSRGYLAITIKEPETVEVHTHNHCPRRDGLPSYALDIDQVNNTVESEFRLL